MASWNSIPLEISYEIIGWIAFASWSISFYPQLILNFRRKSPTIQKQYFDTYGDKEMVPVAANDAAFSIHAVVMTALTLFQIFIYERGPQKVSRLAIGIVVVVWGFAAICFFIALPTQSWLWLIMIFNSIQVVMTCVKYIPQVKMNFTRKSTVGWSIGNVFLDFAGGLANYLQMVVQSIDQNSWVNFYGNIGKTLLSLISIFFDIIFMVQHYVLYPEKKASKYLETGQESNEPLIDSSHEHV